MLSFVSNVSCSNLDLEKVNPIEQLEIDQRKIPVPKLLGPIKVLFLSVIMFFVYMGFGFNITTDLLVSDYFDKRTNDLSNNNSSVETTTIMPTTISDMNSTMIPNVMPTKLLSANLNSIYNYIFFISAIVGCLLALSDRFLNSNKKKVTFACGLFSFGYILCGYPMDLFHVVLFGKILTGISVGLICSTAMPLIEEIVPDDRNRVIKVIAASGIPGGALFTSLIAYVIPKVSQVYNQVFLGYGMIFFGILFLFIQFLPWVPSNKVQPKKETSALNSLKTFFGGNKKVIFTIFLVHLLQQLSGINYIFIKASEVFADAYGYNLGKLSSDEMTVIGQLCLGLAGANFVGSILASIVLFFLPSLGKILFFGSIFGCSVSALLIGIKQFPVAMVFFYMISFAFGVGPIPWAITSEIAYQKVDIAQACAFGAVINFAFSFLVAFSVNTILYYYKSDAVLPIYIFFSVSLVVGGVLLAYLMDYSKKIMEKIRGRSSN